MKEGSDFRVTRGLSIEIAEEEGEEEEDSSVLARRRLKLIESTQRGRAP